MGCGTTIFGTPAIAGALSVPSAGLWAVEHAAESYINILYSDFQYPLRAYGLWNPTSGVYKTPDLHFQYPLRAYGLWNQA